MTKATIIIIISRQRKESKDTIEIKIEAEFRIIQIKEEENMIMAITRGDRTIINLIIISENMETLIREIEARKSSIVGIEISRVIREEIGKSQVKIIDDI